MTGDGSRVLLIVILYVTSENTDIDRYSKLLGDDDKLVVVREADVRADKSIVALYNEIVEESDSKSDIMLLSDCADIHDGAFDEIKSCLYAEEKHAIAYGQEIDNRQSMIVTAKKYLPKYSITIFATTNCALVKRTVINTLGFLDESYNSIHYAMTDLYCRINRYGFSAIVSHHTLFSANDKDNSVLCDTDKKFLETRYTHREETERGFADYMTQPGMYFLTLLDDDYYPKKKILFDCITMPPYHCGTSEFQITVFDAFYRLFKDKYDLFLYTNHEADEYHKLSSKYDNMLYPDTIDGTFHIGYAPNQLMFYDNQSEMNKRCLKIIQTMFDIIMARRIDEFFGADIDKAVELGIRLSDGIVFISNNTKNDFTSRYTNESFARDKQLEVIYPTIELTASEKNDYDLPFDSYFLIVGNMFEHKAIKETLEAVRDTSHNFIVIGYGENDFMCPNIFCYMNGHIDSDYLYFLYSKCDAVIYPSLYEGFGLPIVISLKHNKRVILYENNLNKELCQHFFQFKDYFSMFSRYEQIREIIDSMDFNSELLHSEFNDSSDRVAMELDSFFEKVLETKVNTTKLNERWNLYQTIEAERMHAFDEMTQVANVALNEIIGALQVLYRQFDNYKLLPLLKFAVKKHIKHKYPNFFRKIKKE
jgi:glycosyltransferase involved in cell wall biosynthesis